MRLHMYETDEALESDLLRFLKVSQVTTLGESCEKMMISLESLTDWWCDYMIDAWLSELTSVWVQSEPGDFQEWEAYDLFMWLD